jgi:tetratricopeptide (TPR) repeat protein
MQTAQIIAGCPEAQAAAGGAAVPADAAAKATVAQALLDCTLKMRTVDLAAAKAEIAVAHDIAEGLVAAAPANRQHKALLALSDSRLGIVLGIEGDHAGAVRALEAAVALRAEILGGPHPGVMLANLAATEANLGKALRDNGQVDEARAAYGKCIAHRREALERQPENAVWKDRLALCQQALDALAAEKP